jgi:hypothetical protein
LSRHEGILLLVLLIAGIVYAIVDDTPLPPSADAQESVAVACLKRAGFKVTSDIPTGGGYGSNVQYELDIEDEDGARVAIVYLADLPSDIEPLVDHLKDYQKTYGDYKGETIEQRGTAGIRLAKGFNRAGAIHDCVARAGKAKDT